MPSTVTLTVVTQIDYRYTLLSIMDPFMFTDSNSSDKDFHGFNTDDIQVATD